MDQIDRKMLTELQHDASLWVAQLSDQVGPSQTPCWRRVQKLQETGVITGRVAHVDPLKVGLGLTVFVEVEAGDHSPDPGAPVLSTRAGSAATPRRRSATGPGRRVLIVGGGASGVLLAARLPRQGRAGVEVMVVEKGALPGCGVPYATTDPARLLNTRVANMSACPDQPDHFLRWLGDGDPARPDPQGPDAQGPDPQGLVTRATYGRCLGCLLDPWRGGAGLDLRQDDCLGLDVGPDCAVLRADGPWQRGRAR